MGLIIACDGGEVVASYLVNNSIKPDRFVFTVEELRNILTYLNPTQDSILMIVSGMTEWSNVVIYNMCELLQTYERENKTPLDYEILSNIPLSIKQTYTFYHDDLLYGTEELMKWDEDASKFKTIPIKKREDKAISKYIGVCAKETIYTPIERQFQATRFTPEDVSKLKRNLFD